MNTMATSQLLRGIDALQANHLDQASPAFVVDPALAQGVGLVHIQGMFRARDEAFRGAGEIHLRQSQFLTGLYNALLPWGLFLIGTPNALSLYLALTGGAEACQSWQGLLGAAFPGCMAAPGPGAQAVLSHLHAMPHAAAISGNPAMGNDATTSAAQWRLEPLISAMAGTTWAYLVTAMPLHPEALRDTIAVLAREEREATSAFMRPGTVEEHNNPLAQQYIELLRKARQNAVEGSHTGMWDVHAFLLATDPLALSRGSQALSGTMTGPDNGPQPFRIRPCAPTASAPQRHRCATALTSSEAAALSQFPNREFSGYVLREQASFAVSPPSSPGRETIGVGCIVDGGHRSANWFEVDVNDLSKHVFVAGVPGSGKTCTCQYLLSQLWSERHIPWLVVEPSSKSEYRQLLASRMGQDLRVYTLGNEQCAPLRWNPFQILPGIPVQTHIEALSSLLTAAFALVTPMPDVLNQALHRMYADLGWDLLTGTHPRGNSAQVQPTISDLIATLEHLIPSLGYDRQITGNLHAGLAARLRNLTLGGRGTMLNSRASANLEELLARPAILELSAIGDDDSKAFIMASILLHLSEYRMTAGLTGGKLQHVVLIEEAHRLLQKTSDTLATEYANPRGKAVETICQMLAEMRAYGQGFVIVDQAPAKLAPDAIKNSNLKIVHRLVSGDDRSLVGETMNLTSEQQRYLATLSGGEAVLYAEGRDAAFLVRIPDHAGRHGYGNALIPNEQVRRLMHDQIIPYAPTKRDCLSRARDARRGRCGSRDCERSGKIARLLLERDYSSNFARAIRSGPQQIWRFGMQVAQEALGAETDSDAPYCAVMTLLSLANYDASTVENMRQQLDGFRDNEREAAQ